MLQVNVQLGDMNVGPGAPMKLVKALAVVADRLHAEFDRPPFAKNISFRSCILCSLTVRDFLWRTGYKDAQVRPVATLIEAFRNGELLHSAGVGWSGGQDEILSWNGHMVVTIPSLHFLIDTTLYQAKRRQWEWLSGMMALKMLDSEETTKHGSKPIAFASYEDGEYNSRIIWFDRSDNQRWRKSPDTEKSRRAPAVKSMVKTFGRWSD